MDLIYYMLFDHLYNCITPTTNLVITRTAIGLG